MIFKLYSQVEVIDLFEKLSTLNKSHSNHSEIKQFIKKFFGIDIYLENLVETEHRYAKLLLEIQDYQE